MLYLAPYEFHVDWEFQKVKLPVGCSDHMQNCQATLTSLGKIKLENKEALVPGEDYEIRAETGFTHKREWLAFPAYAGHLRHEWVMVRRVRPVVPKFEGQVLMKNGYADDHMRHMSVYFRPWVLDYKDANNHVPHLSQLRQDVQSWTASWLSWINGHVLSKRAASYIHNFQCVFSTREEDPDEQVATSTKDTPVMLSDADVVTALNTDTKRFRKKKGSLDSGIEDKSFDLVKTLWGTMQSSEYNKSLHPNISFRAPRDVKAVLKAARDSCKKVSKNNVNTPASNDYSEKGRRSHSPIPTINPNPNMLQCILIVTWNWLCCKGL